MGDSNFGNIGVVEGKSIKIMMSLDDIEDVQGYVAAEANHTENKKLQKELDKIFNKFQYFLDHYDDQEEGKMVSKQQDNRDFLQSIPPADMKYIINGYLASEASQADADKFIKVYELYCVENKSLNDIAKSFNVTRDNIDQKIQKIIDLVKRNPIMVDKLTPDTDILQISLERLFLSTRTYHCLKNADIVTVGDIVRRGENDLLRIKNFGRKSLNEIKKLLWHLMSRFQPRPWLQEDIEKLKARSDELSTKSAEWSRDDHERLVQVLSELESKVRETRNLIEQVLKSTTRLGHHVMEGFCIPYAVWDRLWSWLDQERNPERKILDVLKKS